MDSRRIEELLYSVDLSLGKMKKSSPVTTKLLQQALDLVQDMPSDLTPLELQCEEQAVRFTQFCIDEVLTHIPALTPALKEASLATEALLREKVNLPLYEHLEEDDFKRYSEFRVLVMATADRLRDLKRLMKCTRRHGSPEMVDMLRLLQRTARDFTMITWKLKEEDVEMRD